MTVGKNDSQQLQKFRKGHKHGLQSTLHCLVCRQPKGPAEAELFPRWWPCLGFYFASSPKEYWHKIIAYLTASVVWLWLRAITVTFTGFQSNAQLSAGRVYWNLEERGPFHIILNSQTCGRTKRTTPSVRCSAESRLLASCDIAGSRGEVQLPLPGSRRSSHLGLNHQWPGSPGLCWVRRLEGDDGARGGDCRGPQDPNRLLQWGPCPSSCTWGTYFGRSPHVWHNLKMEWALSHCFHMYTNLPQNVTDDIPACFGGDKGVALQHWGCTRRGQRGDTWAGEPENLWDYDVVLQVTVLNITLYPNIESVHDGG